MALMCPQLLPEETCRVCVQPASAAALCPCVCPWVACSCFSRAVPPGAQNVCHRSASLCSDFLHNLLAPVKMATLRQRPRDCAAATLMSCLILVSVCQLWCPL